MKEADIILGGFAAENLPSMSDADLATFEALLDEGDNDLVNWILGRDPIPDEKQSDVLMRIVTANERGA